MKQLLVDFNFQDVTSEQYEGAWADLRASGHAHPKGLLYHASAPKPDGGWKVVDIWESEEAFQAFGNVLMPILAKNNIPPTQPDIYPVHWIYEKQMETA